MPLTSDILTCDLEPCPMHETELHNSHSHMFPCVPVRARGIKSLWRITLRILPLRGESSGVRS